MENYVILGVLLTIFYAVNTTLYLKGFIRNNKAFKLFAIYLIAILIIHSLTFFIGKVLHKPNLFLSHFYFIIQFVLLSLFYAELLRTQIIRGLLLLCLGLLTIQYIVYPEIFFEYNAIGMSITQALLVLYSIIYFYRSLGLGKEFIIVNVGIFFYLLSSTLIFASGNLVLNLDISTETKFTLINVNRSLIFIYQLLIFIEWYRNYRIRK